MMRNCDESLPVWSWTWLRDEDMPIVAAADAAAAKSDLGSDEIFRLLRTPANVRMQVMAVFGWAPGAITLIASDPVLSAKTIAWFARPAELAALAAELRAVDAKLDLAVAVWKEQYEWAGLMAYLPLIGWSAVVLGDDDAAALVQRLRTQRIFSATNTAERSLTDLAHALHRQVAPRPFLPLSELAGCYAGKAALCIAAGPSLDRHLEWVRKCMLDCVVIAADIVSARLIDAGIKVDFVVNLDSHELIASRMRPCPDPETVLVMSVNGHRRIDSHFALCSFEGADGVSSALLGGPQRFEHGTNVGSGTLGLGLHLGCSELILVGHDLSYSPERYYASVVTDTAGIEAHNRGASEALEVEGNGGGRVTTNSNFQLGIRDLSLMIREASESGRRVYNLNIADGTGALIPGALRLPNGWQPPSGPVERPRSACREIRMRNLSSVPLADLVRDQIACYLRAWDEKPSVDDLGELSVFVGLAERSDLAIAHELLAPFMAAHVLQLMRLMAQSEDVPTRACRRATADHMRSVMVAATDLIEKVLRSGDYERPVRGSDARLEAFGQMLRLRMPVLDRRSMDESVLSLMAIEARSLCAVLPDIGLPPPHSAYDGVRVLASAGGWVPAAYAAEVLAHCRLDRAGRFAFILDMAQTAGLGDETASAHCHALAALASLDATTVSSGDDLSPALAWWPAQGRAIERLFASLPGMAVTTVTAWLRSGQIESEPGLLSKIATLIDDPEQVQSLLADLGLSWTESIILALARSHVRRREHPIANHLLAAIRPLSLHAEEALALSMDEAVGSDRYDRLTELIAGFPSHEVAILAFARMIENRAGVGTALPILAQQRLDPIPCSILSESLADALVRTDPLQRAERVLTVEILRRRAIAAGKAGVRERSALHDLGELVAQVALRLHLDLERL